MALIVDLNMDGVLRPACYCKLTSAEVLRQTVQITERVFDEAGRPVRDARGRHRRAFRSTEIEKIVLALTVWPSADARIAAITPGAEGGAPIGVGLQYAIDDPALLGDFHAAGSPIPAGYALLQTLPAFGEACRA